MNADRKSKPFIWHPVLFGIFPVLFLYAQNAYEMRLKDALGPFIIVVAVILTGSVILSLVLRDRLKGALMTTLMVMLFFSYGHITAILPDFRLFYGETEIGRNGLVLVVWMVIIYYGFKYLLKSKRDFSSLTRGLNYIGLFLVVIQIGHSGYVLLTRENIPVPEKRIVTTARMNLPKKLPDIYFIIMDGYGRSDILKEIYAYDNSSFIAFLKSRGFYVADSCYVNYCQTLLSLTATLNMNYIDDLGDFDRRLKDRLPLDEKLLDNEVYRFLRERGYGIAAFASGSSMTEFEKADLYLAPSWTVNEFQNTLMATTPLPFFIYNEKSLYALHRKRLKYILNKLPDIYELTSPRFVFAHILCPHPPFVFDAEGNEIEPDRSFYPGDGSHFMDRGGTVAEYLHGYKGQIAYITGRLQKTIEHILDKNKDNPPLIIIQADHGPGSGLSWLGVEETNVKERFSILNAVYLPGGGSPAFYERISPVNTFRIIFNEYFKTDYELLADRSFYATWAHPYNFIEVTRRLGPDIYKARYYPKPWKVAYDDINKPKKQGYRYDSTGCFLLTDDGLQVTFNIKKHNRVYEISVDNNDDYTLYFRRDTTLIARWNISPKIIKEGGLRVDKIDVPQAAVREGYDNVLIVPYGGDKRYSVGHFRLL